MINRQQNIQDTLPGTCDWFYQSESYKNWRSRKHVDVYRGLLWVKGKPGSGKSTLMKNVLLRTQQLEEHDTSVVGFFFNARGGILEKTPLGLLRALIHQLCHRDETIMNQFIKIYKQRKESLISNQRMTWVRPELESFLRRVFREHKPQRTIIFCDALDECDEDVVRKVVYLFDEIGRIALASGADLNICLSSRHYPTISIKDCPEVVMEAANLSDITSYVNDQFNKVAGADRELLMALEVEFIKKANGVFLWAVLVTDLLLQDVDAGQPVDVLLTRLKSVPSQMENLYHELCNSLKTEERLFSVRLIQWVLLADSIIHIQDLCLLVLFSKECTEETLGSWGYTSKEAPGEERLARFVRNATRGLIEYNSHTHGVQFIHETVRDFFFAGGGLRSIDATLPDPPLACSHELLLHDCIKMAESGIDWPIIADKSRMNLVCLSYIHADGARKHGGSGEEFYKRIRSPDSGFEKLMIRDPRNGVLTLFSQQLTPITPPPTTPNSRPLFTPKDYYFNNK